MTLNRRYFMVRSLGGLNCFQQDLELSTHSSSSMNCKNPPDGEGKKGRRRLALVVCSFCGTSAHGEWGPMDRSAV